MNVVLIIIFCIFSGIVINNVFKFIRNENSSLVTEQAYLRRKITSSNMDANNVMNTTFLLEFGTNGGILKCGVTHRVYSDVEENTNGMLTHQGTRFKAFEWNGIRVEK